MAPNGMRMTAILAKILNSIFVIRICNAMMKNENMTRPIVMTYIRALPILSPT